MPAYLQACKEVGYELALEAPAFAVNTPEGVQVTAISVRSTGREDCGSQAAGAGGGTVTITARDLRCEVPGIHTRVGAVLTLVAGATSCTWGSAGTAPGHNWLVELTLLDGRVAGTATWTP